MPDLMPISPDAVTDTEADVSPKRASAPKPYSGFPRNPENPTVAGSIELALWVIARDRLGAK